MSRDDGALTRDLLDAIDMATQTRHVRLITSTPTITCPRCGMTSANPSDVREGYCGNCHDWTGEPA